MRITSKGQVTIPRAVREVSGLLPYTEVEFVVEHNGVRIVKAGRWRQRPRGREAVDRLRASAGRLSLTTDEILVRTRGTE